MGDEAKQTSDVVAQAKGIARFRPLLAEGKRRIRWPWLLVALVPIVAVVVADACGADWFYRKSVHETIALPILVVAAAGWFGRALREHSSFLTLVGIQVVVFLMREIHFKGTSDGVYVATAIVGLLMLRLAWRQDWQKAVKTVDWAMVTAMAVTGACYAMALLVQRRAFKGIPGEKELHVALEEVGETMAHLCFLVAAFVRTRKTSSPSA